jgi:membrane protease YdiL (CAAX protease family)
MSLSRQIIADSLAKLVASVLMVFILTRFADSNLFFAQTGVENTHKSDKAHRWLKIPMLAVIVYMAIYPLVNILILSLSVLFFHHVLHIYGPQAHQAFELMENLQIPRIIHVNTILLALVISPVAEELFFRGLIQNYLYTFFKRPWAAIAVSAILFMAVHIPLYQQMPALWVLGVVLGWSYYRYRTLAMPICLHICFNGGSLLLWWAGGDL